MPESIGGARKCLDIPTLMNVSVLGGSPLATSDFNGCNIKGRDKASLAILYNLQNPSLLPTIRTRQDNCSISPSSHFCAGNVKRF